MAKMDLIIPSYKDKKGLYETLFSIGLDKDIYVTIVDDCSGEKYDDIISWFNQFFPIQVLYMSKNGGPGAARQYGLNNTFNPLVVFIDCGDVFASPQIITDMINEMENNPELQVISYAHQEDRGNYLDYCPPGHNRMHGKIYRRSFLKTYNISFNKDAARANEDIGFNMNCRLICDHLLEEQGIACYGHNENVGVIWKGNANSITRKNDCAFYYKEQNMGLAKNTLYALKNAKQNGVNENIINYLGYDVFASLYTFYLSTLNRRPEFVEEALEGALFYYKNYFGKQEKIDMELLRHVYYDNLAHLLSDESDPIRDKIIPINIMDFIDLLQQRMEDK